MDKKIVTLEALFDRKSKADKMGFKDINIGDLGDVKIVKIKTRKVCEIMDKYDVAKDEEKITSSHDMMCELIYKSMPLLQNDDLRKQLNLATPYELVPELLTFAEMTKLTEEIMKMHGLEDEEKDPVAQELKN